MIDCLASPREIERLARTAIHVSHVLVIISAARHNLETVARMCVVFFRIIRFRDSTGSSRDNAGFMASGFISMGGHLRAPCRRILVQLSLLYDATLATRGNADFDNPPLRRTESGDLFPRRSSVNAGRLLTPREIGKSKIRSKHSHGPGLRGKY